MLWFSTDVMKGIAGHEAHVMFFIVLFLWHLGTNKETEEDMGCFVYYIKGKLQINDLFRTLDFVILGRILSYAVRHFEYSCLRRGCDGAWRVVLTEATNISNGRITPCCIKDTCTRLFWNLWSPKMDSCPYVYFINIGQKHQKTRWSTAN